MKWGAVLGITVIVGIMVLYEWPKINPQQKREKATFIGLLAMGWLLGVLLIFFPDMPKPSKLFAAIFEPFGKMLEQ